MAEELENIGLIDRYINGELTPDEVTAFENKLAADPAFKKAYELHLEMAEGIDQAGDTALKDYLDEVHDVAVGIQKKPYKFYLTLSITAMVAIVVSVLFIEKPFYKPEQEEPVSQVSQQNEADLRDDNIKAEQQVMDELTVKDTLAITHTVKPLKPVPSENKTLSAEVDFYFIKQPDGLMYWFNGEKLLLWGEYNLSLPDVTVKKIGKQYYLKWKDNYYRINDDGVPAKPDYINDVRVISRLNENFKSSGEVAVYLTNLLTPKQNAAVKTTITIDANNPDYANHYLLSEGQEISLTLYGDYKDVEPKLVQIDGDKLYYLVYPDKVLKLKATGKIEKIKRVDDPKRLQQLQINQSESKPLFIYDVTQNMYLEEN